MFSNVLKMNKKGRKVKRSGRRDLRRTNLTNRMPPEQACTIQYAHKFRFNWTGSGGINVTRARLLDLLSVATSTTAAYRIHQSVKVLSVKMYGYLAEGSTLNNNTISLEWVGIYAPSKKIVASSLGTTFPAVIETTPPEDCAAHWWSQSGGNETEILFVLGQSSTTSYTIVDVTLMCMVVDDESATAVAIAPTAAIVGTVYYAPLDGVTLGNCAPASVNTLH